MPSETIKTISGITVYKHYQDNLSCDDKTNKSLTTKAESKRELNNKGLAKGISRFGNESSEDALTWSVFRTLDIKNSISVFYVLLGIEDFFQNTLFWTRTTVNGGNKHPEPQLEKILDEIEPRKLWKQQTEPDVILIGNRTIIFNECKLGKPGEGILGWARSKPFESKHERYKMYLGGVFTKEFIKGFNELGRRFYQLMRNVIIGKFYAETLRREFHLCVVVNGVNKPVDCSTHREKFDEFSTYLIETNKIHFCTWQNIQDAISLKPELSSLYTCLKSHRYLNQPI